MKLNKKDRIIKELYSIRGLWVPDLERLTLRELKKELKLRIKIRDGKILLW